MVKLYDEYPPELIEGNTGFDPSLFEGRFFDVGCGPHGKYVRNLRRMQIMAEGIDRKLRIEREFLIKGDASEEIPRPDNHYQVATAHYAISMGGMWNSYKQVGERVFNRKYTKYEPATLKILVNVHRILRPGGKFIIWPEPRYFIESQREEIERIGFDIRIEDTNNEHIDSEEFSAHGADEFLRRVVLENTTVS